MKGGFQIILFLIQRSFQNKIHAITSLLITFPNELQRKEKKLLCGYILICLQRRSITAPLYFLHTYVW